MGQKKPKAVPASALPRKPDVVLQIPRKLAGVVPTDSDVDANSRKPTWGFALVDHETHDWASWPSDRDGLMKILSFMQEMERVTWRQIRAMMTGGKQRRGAMHKSIPIEDIISEAQARLTALELDDHPELFRFRLGNMGRLWGVFVGGHHVFYPVWWDPDHSICP